MDKNAIKKYAVWARRELIERVSQKALQYEITADGKADPNAEKVNGRPLSAAEKKQRQALIRKVNEQGYEQIMEEAAYTWFNRFSALRFMEVNGYLPSHVRVFTNDEGEFKPQILSEAIHLDLDGLNMDKVYELKNSNREEELFKYLLIVQCNALSAILPQMFQRIEDYTELLFPDYLLREGSVIEQMITLIPEEDWRDQVQIIGWLYQYWNTELNDQVYDGNMSKARIPKELLSAATTIYTPDWPVCYMVENSLGRLWMEGHPNDELKANWKYYLEEADQEPDVQAQLVEIRRECTSLNPEDIKCIDPCMGSGQILCYMFDVLMQIYESQGYSQRDAAQSIVRHNLYGLDIDKRATQLAYFSVMMKARQYDRRFFSRNLQPMIYSTTGDEEGENFGSLVMVEDPGEKPKDPESIFEMPDYEKRLNSWSYRYLLAQKYHVVCTNPPYLGSSRFGPALDKFVKEKFADEKADLCMVMFKQSLQRFCKPNGFVAFITTSSWMFLSSFEKVRKYLQFNAYISSLVDFGTELFDGKVGHNPIVAWVTRKIKINYKMTAIRLVDYCYSRRDEKEPEFFNLKNRYTAQQDNFSKIPGSPVAYWASLKALRSYQNPNMDSVAQPRHGLATSDNDRFLKLWHEIDICKGSLQKRCQKDRKWFPMSKGGSFRRWYGNLEWVINYENDGKEIKDFAISIYKCSSRTIQNTQFYFQEGLTWSALTSGGFSVRWQEEGALFGSGGYCAFVDDSLRFYVLALLNSKVTGAFAQFVSPTLNYEVGHIKTIPVVVTEKNQIVTDYTLDNISLSRADWDFFETSWDFKKHPMV